MPSTQLRRDVAALSQTALGDLSVLWRRVRTPELAETALRDVLPALIETFGAASATVAADWYDEERDKVGARRRFTAIPAEIPNVGAQALVGWALSEAQDFTSFQTLISGGTQRRIANFARLTITGSSIEDPSSEGWVRVGEGACKSGWCDQFLDGEVHAVAYDFPAHDNCNCGAVPAWR
jgi:hypothetical protein